MERKGQFGVSVEKNEGMEAGRGEEEEDFVVRLIIVCVHTGPPVSCI